MHELRDIVCVILAAGRGKRMGGRVAKPCRSVAGRPVIARAIDAYKAAGLQRFLVVVGDRGSDVRAALADHADVAYVRQAAALGTGDAADVAAEALADQGHTAPVVIIMGDKLPRPAAVRCVLDSFLSAGADAAVATGPKTPRTSAGRIVADRGGAVLGIVEQAEIRAATRTRKKIRLAGRAFTAAGIEKRSPTVNLSLYAFRFKPLLDALGKLRDDNAQGELYLTDTLEILAAAGRRVEAVGLADPRDLMAFNTPTELRALRRAFARGRPGARALKAAGEWVDILAADGAGLRGVMENTYGCDAAMLRQRRLQLLRVARAFARHHGPGRKMILIRAPGRVNLMGRHVDHRGGHVNVMAISREVVLAVAPTRDDVVSLRHVRPGEFPARRFAVGELSAGAGQGDWTDFVNSPAVGELLASSRGDWCHYARGAVLRFAREAAGGAIVGMDCVVGGDIPMGAGLSSSSALLVAFAEAVVALNGLPIAAPQFVDMCGQAEWFVGSRGGSADHAAIKTCRRGQISRLAFCPFHDAGRVRLGHGLRVVIAHSGLSAAKSAGARDVFNQRVACYEIGLQILRARWRAARRAEHVRDLTPDRLGVGAGEICRALMLLPQRPTRRQLRKMLTGAALDRLRKIFATHADVGPYDLRGVMLYGIGECIRSERFAGVLRRGDLAEVGRLMRVSHDGDRVVRWSGSASRPRPHVTATDDAALLAMADAGEDLATQCGRYACSTRQIDRLVDLACEIEGVVGAQLAGAGLGGVATILVRDIAVARLLRRLRDGYYRPGGLTFGAQVVAPVGGSGLLKVGGNRS